MCVVQHADMALQVPVLHVPLLQPVLTFSCIDGDGWNVLLILRFAVCRILLQSAQAKCPSHIRCCSTALRTHLACV